MHRLCLSFRRLSGSLATRERKYLKGQKVRSANPEQVADPDLPVPKVRKSAKSPTPRVRADLPKLLVSERPGAKNELG